MHNATKLLNKNFLLIASGNAVSQLGAFVYSSAIILILKEITDSATLIGLNSTLSLVPAVAFGFFAGSIVDNCNRKYLIILTDALRGIAMLALAAIDLLGAARQIAIPFTGATFSIGGLKLQLWMVIASSIFIGLNNVLFNPAINSLLPDIVPSERIVKGNSILQSINQIAQVIGLPLGGIFFGLYGGGLIFLVNGATFLLSALTECFIDIPKKRWSGNASLRYFIDQTREGLSYTRSMDGLMPLLVLLVYTNSLFPPFLLCLPYFIEDYLKLPKYFFGYALGAISGGAILASVFYSIFHLKERKKYYLFVSGFGAITLLSALLNINVSIYAVLLAFVLFGFFNMQINVILGASFQEKISPDFRGRFFGLLQTSVMAAAPISYFLSGVLIDILNKRVTYIFAIISVLLLSMTIYIIRNKKIRNFFQAIRTDPSGESNG